MGWDDMDYWLAGTVHCNTCNQIGLNPDRDVYGDGDCYHCHSMKTDADYKTAYEKAMKKAEEERKRLEKERQENKEYRKWIADTQVKFPLCRIDKAFLDGGVTFATKECFATDQEFSFKSILWVQPTKESGEDTEIELNKYGVDEYDGAKLQVYVNVHTSPETYLKMVRDPQILIDLLHKDGRAKVSNYIAVDDY
ncbi:hypothetical protein P8825_14805 [Shouchella clausii]|uniref:hypothetical protein n=1 Tax=Shouchella clausii TaxID=79880 RepID=UPI002DBB0E83|nr:hypothetical protein [Shouchella clausii]MEB5480833.1 hypothetical protein [Shouchella clausii]